MRLLIVGFALQLGCVTETDPRPQTLEFITETILAPNCATAECHSDLKQQNGYIFDTVEHAEATLAYHDAITPGQPGKSILVGVISTEDSFGNRMPLDHPLANKDIFLIQEWVYNGAAGYTPPSP